MGSGKHVLEFQSYPHPPPLLERSGAAPPARPAPAEWAEGPGPGLCWEEPLTGTTSQFSGCSQGWSWAADRGWGGSGRASEPTTSGSSRPSWRTGWPKASGSARAPWASAEGICHHIPCLKFPFLSPKAQILQQVISVPPWHLLPAASVPSGWRARLPEGSKN